MSRRHGARLPAVGLLLAALVAAPVSVPVSEPVSVPVLAPGATSAPTGAVSARAVVGSPSGGDPYFPLDGNGGYDVGHYDVTTVYDPATGTLRGSTVLRATATRDLTGLHLDLVLTPDRVRVDGVRARFAKPRAHELRVTLPRVVRTGQRLKVRVDYHGRPGSVVAGGAVPGRDLWFQGAGETVAMGEPQNGAWWFAANETPADKATYDLRFRVPRGNQVVSNGALVSRQSAGGQARWHWRVAEPMVSYGAMFVAGRLRLEQGSAQGRPFVYAVSRGLAEEVQEESLAALRRTPEVVGWLEAGLGPYPFGQVGGVVPGVPVPYALETQTRPVYYRGVDDLLLVHELAHQWFGDDVSLRRWRDLWLNEGFATYAEWWWAAEHGGRSVRDTLLARYALHPADATFWDTRVGDPGPARMWGAPVYERGAMTLAALRHRIGDPGFDDLLRTWVTRHRRGHVTGATLRALAEEVSGQDLDGFFAAWLDGTEKPTATVENGLA